MFISKASTLRLEQSDDDGINDMIISLYRSCLAVFAGAVSRDAVGLSHSASRVSTTEYRNYPPPGTMKISTANIHSSRASVASKRPFPI